MINPNQDVTYLGKKSEHSDLIRFKNLLTNGPVAILCATAMMALQDAIVKAVSADLPLWQLFLLRSAFILPVLTILIAHGSPTRLRQALNKWVLLRSVLIVAMYIFFYAGMPLLELPVVSAVYYTGPIFIVLFSGAFLREHINFNQWIAVFAAFIGVLIILRPSGSDFSLAALIPLASALFYACAMVATRGKVGTMSAWVLTLSLNIVFLLCGLIGILVSTLIDQPDLYPFLLTPWVSISQENALIMALLALISIGIHMLLARAYQLGPTAVVASLDFSYLGFSALWAVIFFGTIPGLPVIIGTCLIGFAGLSGLWNRARQR